MKLLIIFTIVSLHNAIWSFIPIQETLFSQLKALFIRSALAFLYFQIKRLYKDGDNIDVDNSDMLIGEVIVNAMAIIL